MYDIFISYAAPDTNDAKTLAEKAASYGLKAFFAPTSIHEGTDWDRATIEALVGSRNLLVLLTPYSADRQWVISEWTLALYHGVTIIPILKDITLLRIPERLRRFECGDFYKTEQLFQRLKADRDACADLLEERQYLFELTKQNSVHSTPYAPATNACPWTFCDCLALAKQQVFFCAQNLHFPLVADETNCRERLFGYLEKGKSASIMICDFQNVEARHLWSWVVSAPIYVQHLAQATRNLQKWVDLAAQKGLALEAKVVPFVPVSATFIDCQGGVTSPHAKLVLTPNAYKADAGERPVILFHSVNDTAVIKYYYLAYTERFKYGRDVRSVDVSD